MPRVAIIGSGPMGLAAAYQATLEGHEVDVIEAGAEPGGMAAHFNFGGTSIERFYHFVCSADQPTFDLLAELGITDKLHWVETSMGFYFRRKIYPWGNPLCLLRLHGAGVFAKMRYALLILACTRRRSWPELESKSARDWLIERCGQSGYEIFWRPLLDYKFYEYAGDISAAWIWTRIKRVGRSRKNIWREELGYIEGGSQTLIDALVFAIKSRGGRIHLNSPARQVAIENNRIVGVDISCGRLPADNVISTIPIPRVAALIPELPVPLKKRYQAIKNIGICCVILKLRRSVSPHFWINIHDDRHEIPGVIEVCEVEFAKMIPPVQTPIDGLQIADTCFYYPEDRGIAESVRLGRQMARAIAARVDD